MHPITIHLNQNMRGSAVAPTTSYLSESESSTPRSSTRTSSSTLIDVVIEATDVRKRLTQRRTASTNLAQLRLSDMKLHGRDDDVAVLHDKLINIQDANRELILVQVQVVSANHIWYHVRCKIQR